MSEVAPAHSPNLAGLVILELQNKFWRTQRRKGEENEGRNKHSIFVTGTDLLWPLPRGPFLSAWILNLSECVRSAAGIGSAIILVQFGITPLQSAAVIEGRGVPGFAGAAAGRRGPTASILTLPCAGDLQWVVLTRVALLPITEI